jgi:hypothetical protein
MVYEHIYLSSGVILDKSKIVEQLLKLSKYSFIKTTEIEQFTDYELKLEDLQELDISIELFKDNMLYPYGCCSELGNKYLFLGNNIKTIYRLYSNRFTNEYEKDYYKKTVDGMYPIDEIYNTIYKMDCNNICANCYHCFHNNEIECPICNCPERLKDYELNNAFADIDSSLIVDSGIFLFIDDCTCCS